MEIVWGTFFNFMTIPFKFNNKRDKSKKRAPWSNMMNQWKKKRGRGGATCKKGGMRWGNMGKGDKRRLTLTDCSVVNLLTRGSKTPPISRHRA